MGASPPLKYAFEKSSKALIRYNAKAAMAEYVSPTSISNACHASRATTKKRLAEAGLAPNANGRYAQDAALAVVYGAIYGPRGRGSRQHSHETGGRRERVPR